MASLKNTDRETLKIAAHYLNRAYGALTELTQDGQAELVKNVITVSPDDIKKLSQEYLKMAENKS